MNPGKGMLALILAGGLAVVGASSLFVVQEQQLALLLRLGEIVDTDDPDTALSALDAGRRVASTNPAVTWTEAIDVTVEALRAANASTPNYSSFYPGLVIVIPAKADC